VRPEGLCKWKIPMTASGIEPATCSSVSQPSAPSRAPVIFNIKRIMNTGFSWSSMIWDIALRRCMFVAQRFGVETERNIPSELRSQLRLFGSLKTDVKLSCLQAQKYRNSTCVGLFTDSGSVIGADNWADLKGFC